jgi:hypothetical protein
MSKNDWGPEGTTVFVNAWSDYKKLVLTHALIRPCIACKKSTRLVTHIIFLLAILAAGQHTPEELLFATTLITSILPAQRRLSIV